MVAPTRSQGPYSSTVGKLRAKCLSTVGHVTYDVTSRDVIAHLHHQRQQHQQP